MGHSLLLFTASLFTAQVQEVRTVSHNVVQGGCVSSSCGANTVGCCENTCCDSGGGIFGFGLLDRLRTRFRGHDCSCDCTPACGHGSQRHTCNTGCDTGCDSGCDSGIGGGRLLGRIRDRITGLFHRGCASDCDNCSSGCADGACGNPAPVVPGQSLPVNPDAKKMPTKATAVEPPLNEPRTLNQAPQTPRTIVQAANQQPSPANNIQPTANTRGRSPLNPNFVNRIGREDDYSWITGQLEQVQGRWVIHYATPETIDRFGGTLVLAPQTDMRTFQAGDLVNINGNVMYQNGTQGLIYRANNVHLIERAK